MSDTSSSAVKALTPCAWAKGDDYLEYHNNEWGIPNYDRQKLFEKLCLEGQQAGLSWITVLRKRDHYRQCFYGFNPQKIARMTDEQIETLLTDAGLIRNRLKLYGIRKNALALLALEKQGIDFVELLWSFVGGKPVINRFASMKEVPAETAAAKAMSKALKKAGFTFVGPTICYAFMQSMGLVNDHMTDCPCHPDNQA
ncbi:DNA-3-methyladenine glycosylase I [Thalassolituus alkanivorans]|uniref:DNA-3-methyladenine glycosylase I n=1 Tax=Thalassolituus alkanivorans TaxID=2881055 RepID=UPI001E5A4360|nr:DNA-3-methyladenine glycosylase I [Thalassolituus alkanivorans]MCB2387412.1 DNA-3-methyladenine glycosylase I [Thalassolituus alkanivorans]MCB2425093.1 DNA-3-methyladenine glycosylase I [Thalassolituus alkanivorans]